MYTDELLIITPDGTITASDMSDCCVGTVNSFDKKQTGISVGVDCDSVTPKTIPMIAITANTETPNARKMGNAGAARLVTIMGQRKKLS